MENEVCHLLELVLSQPLDEAITRESFSKSDGSETVLGEAEIE
jgi:hypothetical protein